MKTLIVMLNERKRTLIPPALAIISATLKQGGIDTKIFDTSFYSENGRLNEEDSKEDAGIFQEIDYSRIGVKIKTGLENDFIDIINNWNPDLIAFSVHSFTFDTAVRLSRLVKDKFGDKIKILFGGIHITLDYQNIFKEKSIDYLCIGEGELALLEFCQKMEKGEPLTDIKNIWYQKNGELIKTGLRPPVNLDSLPIPDWEGFADYHQYGPWRGKLVKMALVEFSRVCPFSCAYCGNHIMIETYAKHGIKLGPHHKSPKKFIEELKYLKERYDLEFIAIMDGTFLSFPDDCLEELAELYSKEINLPFYVTTTASSITERRVALMEKMGCVCMNIGVENGDFEYRKIYMNRPWPDELIINAFKRVKKSTIEARAYNIIGAPFETRETIMKTIELNREIEADSSSLAIFIPFPGCKMREMCIEKGLFRADQKIEGDGTIPVIKNDNLTDDEIIGLFKTFMLYLKAPRELFPIIRLAEGNDKFAEELRQLLKEIYLPADKDENLKIKEETNNFRNPLSK
jgi:anaerobic magnesium-protoporphyrin IX monomethyl ester cyclase